jgi:2-iminobutanoate/2-iminopropanoate deaminase
MTSNTATRPGGQMKHIMFTACLFFSVVASAQSDRTFVKSKLAAERHLPFSSAVLVGNTLYVAGTTADPKNLAAGLTPSRKRPNGMSMDDVVSVQVFCTDLTLYEMFNSTYRKYFGENFPARSFLGVVKLLFGARFEVNAVAVARTNNVKK